MNTTHKVPLTPRDLERSAKRNVAMAQWQAIKNNICKNAKLSIDEYDVRLVNDGCPNRRRNGSAFCKKCSDEHKRIHIGSAVTKGK